MATLHIEHPITDLDTWRAAFDGFADRRRAAGVRRERVSRPVDDANYIFVDLDFDRPESAHQFLGFLREKVWSSSSTAPGLAGAPSGRVLQVEYETGPTDVSDPVTSGRSDAAR